MGRKHGKSRSKFTTVTDMLIAGALKGKEVECDRL
jgi:hypothetical protein